VEAFVPALAVPLEPHRLFLQSARAQLALPHAPDLLRGDEPRLLQNADVLLHARERHVELLGKVRDRSVGSSELLQNATPRGVRERGERSIKSGRHILNHMVQYIPQAFAACKGWPRRTMRPQYEDTLQATSAGRREHVGARADLKVVAADISKQLRLLDKVVRYRFGDNAELMGAWESARNVAGSFQTKNEPESGAGGSATPKAA